MRTRCSEQQDEPLYIAPSTTRFAGVPWATFIQDANAGYVGASPWGPSKNTYQRCTANNNPAQAPLYQDWPNGAATTELSGTSLFSCRMAKIIKAGFSISGANLTGTFAKGKFFKVSDCPDEFLDAFN